MQPDAQVADDQAFARLAIPLQPGQLEHPISLDPNPIIGLAITTITARMIMILSSYFIGKQKSGKRGPMSNQFA